MNTPHEMETVIVSLPARLFPTGHSLALHPRLSLFARLTLGADGSSPWIVEAAQLSGDECGVLVALLSRFPKYCPYEVVLCHVACDMVSENAVALCRERLQRAREGGSWREEMARVLAALSSVNEKLGALGLKISAVLETGYVLLPYPLPPCRAGTVAWRGRS